MKKTQLISSIILTILILSILAPTIASAKTEEKTPVIVGFKDSKEKTIIRDNGWEVKHEYKIIPAVACKLTDQQIQELLKNTKVDYIEEDTIVILEDPAPDPNGDNIASWSIKKIGADIVQASGNKGAGIKVAVIDTGINYQHDDLPKPIIGYDFVNEDNDPMDDNGHGTHCAGIIAAQDNSINVVGVSPGVSLYALKVLNAQGSGSTSDIIAAIQWSITNDMDIVSMSFGSSTSSTPLQQACNAAFSSNIVLVAAAGNNGAAFFGTNILYPARYSNVIAVGATNENNVRASFSNTGPELDIMAPGVNIYSTYIDVTPDDGKNQDSLLMSGTSMAAPHIAGTAALILNSGAIAEIAWKDYGYTDGNGVWSSQEVTNILISTADDLGATGKDNYYGYGIVDADQAAMVPSAPPQPHIKSYAPTSVTTTTGSVTSGDYQSLVSDNEVYLTVESAKKSADQRVDWYSTTTIFESKTQVTALSLTYDISFSKTVTPKIYLYNFASNRWYQISSQSIGTWSTNNPSNYISDNGEIRLRTYATQRTPTSYNCLADYTAYTITYAP